MLKSSYSKVTLNFELFLDSLTFEYTGIQMNEKSMNQKKGNWIMFIESFISESIISDKDLLSTHQ